MGRARSGSAELCSLENFRTNRSLWGAGLSTYGLEPEGLSHVCMYVCIFSRVEVSSKPLWRSARHGASVGVLLRRIRHLCSRLAPLVPSQLPVELVRVAALGHQAP